MLNLTGVLERVKKSKQAIDEYDDFFLVDAKKTRINIKTADDQVYIFTNYLYVIFVKNLNEQECLLHIVIDKPDPEVTSSSSQKIVVKKGQYIKLKQEGQYQESLKKREQKYNHLPINRFKNWAKDIWDTKQKEIIAGLIISLIAGTVFFLLNLLTKAD